MSKKIALRRLNGAFVEIVGELVGQCVRFNGFARSYIGMSVALVPGEGYFALHVDTARQVEACVLVDQLHELYGWFGYCPLAQKLYEDLQIGRAAA